MTTYEKNNFFYNARKFTFYPAVLNPEGFEVARPQCQVEVRGTGDWPEVCERSLFHQHPPGMQMQHSASPCGPGETGKLIGMDWELGQVLFYNMNSRFHSYAFPDMFTEKLRLYFSTGLT